MRKPKSVVKRINLQKRVAIAFVIAATVFGIIASGLKAADDNTYQTLHSVALVVMLIAYIYFISTVLSSKNDTVRPLELSASPKQSEQNLTLLDMNCLHDQILHINDSKSDWIGSYPWCLDTSVPIDDVAAPAAPLNDSTNHRTLNIAQAISLMASASKQDRNRIRAVVVRDTPINFTLMKLLGNFPNLSVLDIQSCSLTEDVWHEFVHFDHLTHVLAFGAISKDDYRQLAYVLPEIRFWIEPCCLRTYGAYP